MPAERDPRMNPKVGDVLETKYARRRVIDYRTTKFVANYPVFFIPDGGPDWPWGVSGKEWRMWARGAKVIHRAD